MAAIILTQEYLKQHLHYDKDTGIFTRLKNGKIAGFKDPRGYVSMNLGRRLHYAHRLAWMYETGSMPENSIDHINGNKSDNRFQNLREATQQQNVLNVGKRARNSSGYKGVSFSKAAQKYEARYRFNKTSEYLGLFNTAYEAHVAYENHVKSVFGEFYRPPENIVDTAKT
jgi:hypothetical protein